MSGDIIMAVTTDDTAAKPATDTSATDSGVEPATTFSPSGAPHQVVPDVDPDHPAVDNDPRKNTTADMNRIDFNDPTKTGAEIAAEQLDAASKTKS
jgi:hypothetical protein